MKLIYDANTERCTLNGSNLNAGSLLTVIESDGTLNPTRIEYSPELGWYLVGYEHSDIEQLNVK